MSAYYSLSLWKGLLPPSLPRERPGAEMSLDELRTPKLSRDLARGRGSSLQTRR